MSHQFRFESSDDEPFVFMSHLIFDLFDLRFEERVVSIRQAMIVDRTYPSIQFQLTRCLEMRRM